jgi:hypothetical protein
MKNKTLHLILNNQPQSDNNVIYTHKKYNASDKVIIIKYIKYIFEKFYFELNKYELYSDNYFLSLKNFSLLPTHFIINNNSIISDGITINDNIIITNKEEIRTYIYSDRILPFIEISSIPFTFPIIKNIDGSQKILLLNSNVFYYEIIILENNQFPIFIGYGFLLNKNNIKNMSYFGINTSGYYIHNNLKIELNIEINKGDIIGAGLIYTDFNKYMPFFTLNGILLSINNISCINANNNIIPALNISGKTKIKYNFNLEQFSFNIERYLFNNNIFSNNNIFLQTFDSKYYETQKYITNKNELFTIFNNTPMLSLNNTPLLSLNNAPLLSLNAPVISLNNTSILSNTPLISLNIHDANELNLTNLFNIFNFA